MRLLGTSSDPEFLRTLGVVSGGHLLSHLYILAYPPLFPLLIDDFGLNNTQLGLIMSVVALSMFLFQTPVGELVDRIGAKRVFVLGLLFTGGGTALVGTATSYPLLLAFALVAGIGQSAFHPADYTLLDAVTEGSQEGRSFGVHTFAGYAGFAVAPALVGGLGVLYGWQIALFVVGGVGVAYAVLAQLFMAPVHRQRLAEIESSDDDTGGILSNLSALAKPAILGMFGFFVVITMANKGIQTFTTLFVATDLSLTEVIGNTALTVYFSLAAGGVLVGGALADRYNVRGVIVGTLTLAALVTWLTTTPIAAVGTVVVALFGAIGFFYGLALPARDRLINAFTTAETTGKSFGFVYTGLPLGGFVAPLVLGGMIDLGYGRLAFLVVGGFFVLTALTVVGLKTLVSGTD